MASKETKKEANPEVQVQSGSSLFEVQVKVEQFQFLYIIIATRTLFNIFNVVK
jgi:hypothetical protein